VLAEARRRGVRPALSEVVLVGSNLASRLPLTILPLDVARRLTISRRDLIQLTGELGDLLRRGSARWLRRAALLRGRPRFAAFDLAAAAYALDPALVETRETTARATRRLWIGYGRGGRPVRLVTDLDREAIWRRFVGWVNGAGAGGGDNPDL
jgi:inosine-uridine nucleoside N-ribohydrolase